MICKCVDEANFVLPRCEKLPLNVETSEHFLWISDGSGKRVARLTFDENIKKRNLLILFKLNGDLNVLVLAIEIRKKLNSSVLIVK